MSDLRVLYFVRSHPGPGAGMKVEKWVQFVRLHPDAGKWKKFGRWVQLMRLQLGTVSYTKTGKGVPGVACDHLDLGVQIASE